LLWERRLRDLVMTGGTIAVAAACNSSSPSIIPGGCCNANPDPCCQCDDAAPSAECITEMRCQDAGGTYFVSGNQCSLPGDGGPQDAATSDAPADGHPEGAAEAGGD
jgi:hypothetical protein